MAKSAKTFLQTLEQKYPSQVIRIKGGPLKPHENECSSIVWQLKRAGKVPATIFENLQTISGKKWEGYSQWQQEGSYARIAIACDLPEERWQAADIFQELTRRLNNPIKPEVIIKDEAPVKHKVVTGEDVNFFDLPLYRKDEKDARPGWICGLAIGKDPETGRYNLSWHRNHIHGPQRSAARLQYRHLWSYLQKTKAMGKKEMPVAWIFGAHPLLMLAGAVRPGYESDEYDVAGGLLNEPLRLVPSATLGDDFLIPADAEVIVEGYLHVEEKEFLGPWVDFMRYYSPQVLEPVFRPTAFNFAETPIAEHNWVGHNTLHGEIGYSITLTRELQSKFPKVKVAHRIQPYTCVVQFTPTIPGEAQRLAHYALVSIGDFIKNVIIVDEDINPFDVNDVLWAVGTRVDANTNQVQIVRDLNANRHDPSSFSDLLVGGFIIDATKPVGKPFPELGVPERAVVERIKLEDFLSLEQLDKLAAGGGSQITGMGI
jgi:2,5-furandicarboxylate decarboxylase 1